jgi:squalene-hopene/tetraprenyl-beta-curcumene cyclase
MQLEGDMTLESYWILIDAFLQRGRIETVHALADVIRRNMSSEGGWHQYPGGPPEISVSCLSYLALKIAGDGAALPHMQRARERIALLGGPEQANTYTRYHLALFGQYPWSRVPALPPEMVLLPDAGPFSIYDMSSWSRTIFVPLSILYAKRPVCSLAQERGVSELFEAARQPVAPEESSPRVQAERRPRARALPTQAQLLHRFFFGVDRALKVYERRAGNGPLRLAALSRATDWMLARMQNTEGLSAILPAMSNSVMALHALGFSKDDPMLRDELAHLDALLFKEQGGDLRVQPCLSPVWDTVLAAHALLEAGVEREHPALRRAASWLLSKQCRGQGDWSLRNPALPGGWYFENSNGFYPDVDDTCMALMVLRRTRAEEPEEVQDAAITRGLRWMLGMQNADGGFASFDRDNDKQWLCSVPFADHNAMIDPSSADITGRVLECLSQFPEFGLAHPVVVRMLQFLRQSQTLDGSWYGRWGVNYLYGTWQVLRGLGAIGEDMQKPWVRRAVRWLLRHQNPDGGWGESMRSYEEPRHKGEGASTPTQTAWALMGLMAAGKVNAPAVRQGAQYLLRRQTKDGTWEQPEWSGTGFPRVFYLNYHGYRHYFPLMALGQYTRLAFPR